MIHFGSYAMIQNGSSIFDHDHKPTDSSRPRAFRMVSVRTGKSGRTFVAHRETPGGWNWAAGIGRGANSHSESVRGGGPSVHFRKWRRPRSAITKRSTEKYLKKVSSHHSRVVCARCPDRPTLLETTLGHCYHHA